MPIHTILWLRSYLYNPLEECVVLTRFSPQRLGFCKVRLVIRSIHLYLDKTFSLLYLQFKSIQTLFAKKGCEVISSVLKLTHITKPDPISSPCLNPAEFPFLSWNIENLKSFKFGFSLAFFKACTKSRQKFRSITWLHGYVNQNDGSFLSTRRHFVRCC